VNRLSPTYHPKMRLLNQQNLYKLNIKEILTKSEGKLPLGLKEHNGKKLKEKLNKYQ